MKPRKDHPWRRRGHAESEERKYSDPKAYTYRPYSGPVTTKPLFEKGRGRHTRGLR